MIRGRFGRVAALVLGDTLALYIALVLMLVVRYGPRYFDELVEVHFYPFTLIFAMWILIFYIAGIYDLRRLRNGNEFWKTLSLAVGVNAALAVLAFYLVPIFGVAPKTNLFLFIAIFAVVEFFWRRSFNGFAARGAPPYNMLLVADGEATQMIAQAVRENPQLGYNLMAVVPLESAAVTLKEAQAQGANLIVVPLHMRNHEEYSKMLYGAMNAGTHVMDVPRFAEVVLNKIPLEDIDEPWILGHALGEPEFYDGLKRGFEIVFALALGIVLLPLELLIALAVKLTPGPAVYSQKRVGKNGAVFTLYKFRTMRADAEAEGAKWSSPGDTRVTLTGKVLRASHLDELPQLANILRGDLSFVGPRPERPEFVSVLKEKIPFYETRHLVLPGITGWAQINYRYGSSEEDAARKLEYDIYYIKNRSLILDIAIILKTFKSFFSNQK